MSGSPGIASADSLWCTARAPWPLRDSQELDLLGQLASYDLDGLTQKVRWMVPRCFKGQLETKWTSFLPVKGCLSTATFSSCLPCSFSPLLTPSFRAQKRARDATLHGKILSLWGRKEEKVAFAAPSADNAFSGKKLTNRNWHWEAPTTFQNLFIKNVTRSS